MNNYPEFTLLLLDHSVGTSNVASDVLKNLHDNKTKRNDKHRFKVIYIPESGSVDQWGPNTIEDMKTPEKRLSRWTNGFHHEATPTKEPLDFSRCLQEIDRTLRLLEEWNKDEFKMAFKLVLFHARERIQISESDLTTFFSHEWTFLDIIHFTKEAYEQCVGSSNFSRGRTLHILQDKILLQKSGDQKPTKDISYFCAYMKLHSDLLSKVAVHFKLRPNIVNRERAKAFHTWKPQKPRDGSSRTN